VGIKRNTQSPWSNLTANNIIAPERKPMGLSGPSRFVQKNHSDLRRDPRYQAEAEKFLSYLSEQEGIAEKLTGGLVSSDIFETLRDEEGRLLTVTDRARVLRDAPEDIKQSYRYLRDNFEESKAGSFGEMLKATFDRGVDMVADPINLAFLLVAPGVGSVATRASTGAATKVLTSQAGKQSVKKTLNNVAASNTDGISARAAGVAGAFEGGVWTGVENANRQDINITTGLQDAFSDGDFALSVGFGTVFGGGLGYGLTKMLSRGSTNVAETGNPTTPTRPPPNSSASASASSAAEQEAEATLSGLFNKVELKTDSRGRKYYDRQGNPEVNLDLLKRLKKELGNEYDDIRVANIILGIKDTIFQRLTPEEIKKGLNVAIRRRTLQINDIDPRVLSLFEQYGLKHSEIDKAIRFVKDTYMKDAKVSTPGVLGGQQVKKTIITDLDDDAIFDIAEDLAAKTGGGQRTSEVLTDAINEANATRGITNTARESSILRRTLHLASSLNARYLTGKITGIFNKYEDFGPNVVKAFKESITSGSALSWRRGSQIRRDTDDFSTVFNEEFGKLTHAWGAIYSPIQTKALGKFKEELDTLLSNAIRTNDMKALSGATRHLSKDARRHLFNIVKFSRNQLKEIGDEVQGKGLVNNLIDNYLPRLWKRSEIENNRERFIDLLENNVNWKQHIDLEDGARLSDREKAEKVLKEMLDIKHQLGNDSGTGMNSFFARRQLELKDEAAFADFLDNDLNNIMVSYHRSVAKSLAKDTVWGVRSVEDFDTTWFPALEKEMQANGATQDMIADAKKDMIAVYQNVTGEGIDRFTPRKQFLADAYMLANRMALLPLSTLSSLSEIFINVSKAGVGTAFRGYRDAIFNGSKKMFDDSLNGLQKSFNMTRKEAMSELNQMGIALDQAFADYADRLGGDALASPKMREISNKFFRFTLLDQWTKGVQTASYITGKRLIAENLESIAAHMPLIQAGKTSRRVQRQIDELFDLDIDYKEGVEWLNKGASLTDDFYRKLKKGAGTYTNEVILNPSAASGIKPMYMSNPKTAILGQLLGYPAAFTNTVMKNMVRQIARNPETALTQHIPAVAMMAGVATFTNGVRTQGESFNGEPHEVIGAALTRAGFNGLPADMYMRGRTAAEIYQSPTAYMTGLGPFWGDAYKIGVSADIFSVIGQKVPGYGAFNAVFGAAEATEDWPGQYRDMLRHMDRGFAEQTTPEGEVISRKTWEKGGEVRNVPQVNPEPDQRIDKMTGLPYDIQAGGAFVDEEDRQGFGLGSIAKTLSTPAKKAFSSITKPNRLPETPTPPSSAADDIIKIDTPQYPDESVAELDLDNPYLLTKKEGKELKESLPKGFPRKEVDELQQSIIDLRDEKISPEEHDMNVHRLMPIEPIKGVPALDTFKTIAAALNRSLVQKGLIGLNKLIRQGKRVGARLDISAYENNNVWVVALHEPGRAGKAIGYGKTSVLDDVEFTSDPEFFAKVGVGTKTPSGKRTAKGPLARIEGNWNDISPEDARGLALEADASDEWIEVGFNPDRHTFFYDKANGKPLGSAERVIQIGAKVLARKPVYRELRHPAHQIKTTKGGVTHLSTGGKVLGSLGRTRKYEGGDTWMKKGAAKLGFDDDRQVQITADAVDLTNQIVPSSQRIGVKRLVPEDVPAQGPPEEDVLPTKRVVKEYKMTTDELRNSGSNRDQFKIDGDEEVFDAVNHALFGYESAERPVTAFAGQAKEVYQGAKQALKGKEWRTELKDMWNNSWGINQREQGLSRPEFDMALAQAIMNTNNKLKRGEPLRMGEDIVLNELDLAQRDQRNTGGKLLGSLHRSNCK